MGTATADTPSITFKLPDLIDALEARRPWAEAIDARNLAKHQADEKNYLKAFRAACREAVKWDYATVKAQAPYGDLRIGRGRDGISMPSCPISIVTKLDKALAMLGIGSRQRCVVSPKGQWAGIYWLLTYDENAPKDALC